MAFSDAKELVVWLYSSHEDLILSKYVRTEGAYMPMHEAIYVDPKQFVSLLLIFKEVMYLIYYVLKCI